MLQNTYLFEEYYYFQIETKGKDFILLLSAKIIKN